MMQFPDVTITAIIGVSNLKINGYQTGEIDETRDIEEPSNYIDIMQRV